MFEKIKKIKQLREIQNSLSSEKIESEKRGVKVFINGKMQVEEVLLNPELTKEEQEQALKGALNDALKKVQLVAAKKMSQFPDLLK